MANTKKNKNEKPSKGKPVQKPVKPIFRTLRNLFVVPGQLIIKKLMLLFGTGSAAVAGITAISVATVGIIVLMRFGIPFYPIEKKITQDREDCPRLEENTDIQLEDLTKNKQDHCYKEACEILKKRKYKEVLESKDFNIWKNYIDNYWEPEKVGNSFYKKYENLGFKCFEPEFKMSNCRSITVYNLEELECLFFNEYISAFCGSSICTNFYNQKRKKLKCLDEINCDTVSVYETNCDSTLTNCKSLKEKLNSIYNPKISEKKQSECVKSLLKQYYQLGCRPKPYRVPDNYCNDLFFNFSKIKNKLVRCEAYKSHLDSCTNNLRTRICFKDVLGRYDASCGAPYLCHAALDSLKRKPIEEKCDSLEAYLVRVEGTDNECELWFRWEYDTNCPPKYDSTCQEIIDNIHQLSTVKERCESCEDYLKNNRGSKCYSDVKNYCDNAPYRCPDPCDKVIVSIEKRNTLASKCKVVDDYLQDCNDCPCKSRLEEKRRELDCPDCCELILNRIKRKTTSSLKCQTAIEYRDALKYGEIKCEGCIEEVREIIKDLDNCPPKDPCGPVYIEGRRYTTRETGPLCFTEDDVENQDGSTLMTWSEARKTCIRASSSNWRLPCEGEIDHYINRFYSDPYNNLLLNNPSHYSDNSISYWLGTEANDREAWVYTFYSGSGEVILEKKNKNIELRCRCIIEKVPPKDRGEGYCKQQN